MLQYIVYNVSVLYSESFTACKYLHVFTINSQVKDNLYNYELNMRKQSLFETL